MATNKNALIRYKVLDRCFRNPGRRYFIDDLIEECNLALQAIDPESGGISRRQVLEDIAFMESTDGWSVDLKRERDGRRVFFRYMDLSFSINNMPLNEVDLNNLKSAVDILSQFKGMPQFEWMHELVPKLQQGAVSDPKKIILEFDDNQYLKGIERLGFLHNAILYKKVLNVVYHPFDQEEPFDVVIHPYYLKQYNNRWFLFGYNPEKEKYDWNLALDRIVEATEIKQKYQKNSVIDWTEYFEDMIGVTKPSDSVAEKVVLRFFKPTAMYIESKPLHGSQRAKWVENVLEVSLTVILNYELERIILSYADTVTVISPKGLKERLKKRLRTALEVND
jgi:predicted DNA-binding transcriptional regulator YafY